METLVKESVEVGTKDLDALAKIAFGENLTGGNSSKEQRRKGILEFEKVLSEVEGATYGDTDLCPLTHRFSDQMYVREIFIPKETLLTGKIHKHDHPNFLMSGKVVVLTEDGGKEFLEGPLTMVSPAGTKRALYSITDVLWVTVHNNPSNTRDLKKLEKQIIAKDYTEYEESVRKKGVLFLVKNIINKMIGND